MLAAEAGEMRVLTLAPDVLEAALDGPWAEAVTHVVYYAASFMGVQVSPDTFKEVY